MTREELCRGLALGDEGAWSRFVSEFGPVIYALAGRFHLQPADRDDLFQRACLAVVRHIESLRDPSRLASWTYGIAFRLAIDSRRRQKPEVALDDADPADPSLRLVAPEVLRELERLERAALLRDALARIGDRCRRFLTAIYLEEPPASYEEICRREGLPLGSIGPTRGRCLEKLRKALADLPEFAPAKDLPAQVSDPPRAPSTKQPPEPGGARSRRRGRSG